MGSAPSSKTTLTSGVSLFGEVRISRLVKRPANAATSCRDGMDDFCSAAAMALSNASRKGAEAIRELLSMAPVACAYSSLFTALIITFDTASR